MKKHECLNRLCTFLEFASLKEPTKKELSARTQKEWVDVLVLFGGSILAGADLFARAIQEGIAHYTVIVGGYGHTSSALFEQIRKEIPDLNPELHTEAEVLQEYLRKKYHVQADYLETRSTNCGNNITFLKNLLQENNIPASSLIFIQDATMQRRMAAGFEKEMPDTQILSLPAYQVRYQENGYQDPVPHGMWEPIRHQELLMGEMVRLHDDENGYGPGGKNYIAHVDIDNLTWEAFRLLQQQDPERIREADCAFAIPLKEEAIKE